MGTVILDGATAFGLHDTHGMPMSAIVDIAAENGAVVDADGFIRAAVRHGWKDKTIERAFTEAQDAVTKAPVWCVKNAPLPCGDAKSVPTGSDASRFWGLVECSDGTVLTHRQYLGGYRSASDVPYDYALTSDEQDKMDAYACG